nr:hypothetical protein [Tanacetum cinerariifolium]
KSPLPYRADKGYHPARGVECDFEGECDVPPEPKWEGTISSFGGAIILPSITPVVKKARKTLAKKNAKDEEKPTLINILARPCAPMAPAISASAAPKQTGSVSDYTKKLLSKKPASLLPLALSLSFSQRRLAGSSFPLTRKVANSLVLRAAYANSSKYREGHLRQ